MMRKGVSRWVLLVTWLLSLAAVFLLGMLSGMSVVDGRTAFVGNSGQRDFLSPEAALAIETLSGRSVNYSERDSGEFVEQVVRALGNLNSLTDVSERTYKAALIAAALPQSQLVKVLQILEQQPGTPARDEALVALLQHWGSLDPRSAMAYAAGTKGSIDHDAAVQAVLTGWARANHPAAWNWVINNAGSGRAAERRASTVVLEAARKNVDQAFDMALSLRDEELRGSALEAFFYHLLRNLEPSRAAQWLQDVPAGAARDTSAAYIAGEWARYSPEEAARWTENLDVTDGRVSAIARVAESWAQQRPGHAAAWTMRLPPGLGRAAAAEAVAEAFINRSDPTALGLWLNEVEHHPDFDPAIRVLALDTQRYDVATAFSWALSLMDPNEREFTTQVIARRWLQADEAAASAAIRASGLPDRSKRLLLGEPMETVAATNEPPRQNAPSPPPAIQYRTPGNTAEPPLEEPAVDEMLEEELEDGYIEEGIEDDEAFYDEEDLEYPY